MTVADRPSSRAATGKSAPRANVVEEIAARRLADIRRISATRPRRHCALARRGTRAARRRAPPGRARAAPDRRDQARLAVGRARSPAVARTSSRAPAPTKPAAPPRSRSCASRIGSAVLWPTSALSGRLSRVPVLAKDFVVDPIQLPLLRAAGADLVLLLAVLHPPRRLAALVAGARPRSGAARRGPRRARARARARQRRPADRAQQSRPADARRRHRACRSAP